LSAPTPLAPFAPAPVPDLEHPEVRAELRTAFERERAQLGGHALGHAGGSDLAGEGVLRSDDPTHPDVLVGTAAIAGPDDVANALSAAWTAFDAWRQVPDAERIGLLRRVADVMRVRQAELAALVLIETGKTWDEATGEVAESIDFLEYHAIQLMRVRERAATALEAHPRERNSYRYLPLGAGAALPPWPFPIAQFTGMASAAVVTGNTLVVKPASLAPMTARRVFDVWREAGTPDGVLNLLFGPGPQVGHALAGHPRTRFVTLTGSAATGVAVAAAASRTLPSRRWFTRVHLELAGKNPVVVDETADLDAAAAGIVSGAFSFQGQKCSAGSRLIVVRSVHDELLERLLARVETLTIGDPADPATRFGPLIDDAAVARVLAYVGIGRVEGRVVAGGRALALGPRYVLPTVIDGIAPSSRLAREEILGPVLTVIAVEDLEAAFTVANDSDYGLTGSYYSGDPERLARAADRLHVGSLYLNRKPTASEVGFHPFGGFGMSGTDAKAGGPDYLLHYLQAQTVTLQP
jgi:1-pyrroline-5-carboxylate dehydrogenase